MIIRSIPLSYKRGWRPERASDVLRSPASLGCTGILHSGPLNGWKRWTSQKSTGVEIRDSRQAGGGADWTLLSQKWKASIPDRRGQGHRAPLLRVLLFGFLQALEEGLFQEVQLLQGRSEEGGHVADEDAGPSIVVSSRERESRGSV